MFIAMFHQVFAPLRRFLSDRKRIARIQSAPQLEIIRYKKRSKEAITHISGETYLEFQEPQEISDRVFVPSHSSRMKFLGASFLDHADRPGEISE